MIPTALREAGNPDCNIQFYFTTMALPLETEVCNYPEHGIEITLKHRHGDIAMIFMHNYIANIILDWDAKPSTRINKGDHIRW